MLTHTNTHTRTRAYQQSPLALDADWDVQTVGSGNRRRVMATEYENPVQFDARHPFEEYYSRADSQF
jgi:hypothetical protein